MEFFIAHKVEVLGFLLALSEVLALFPKVKANSIFQLAMSVLIKLMPKDDQPQPKA